MAKRRYSYEESHRTVNGVKQKRCTKCKEWKSESEFGKLRRSKDGLRWWCFECRNERRQRYYDPHRKTTRRNYKYEQSHRVVDGVRQKRCSKCKRWKAESKFHRVQGRKDGLATCCKKCASKASMESYRKRRSAVKEWLRMVDTPLASTLNGASSRVGEKAVRGPSPTHPERSVSSVSGPKRRT